MGKNEREEKLVFEAGDATRVQRDQLFRAEEQMGQMHRALDEMALQGEGQDHALEEMMAWMAAAKKDPETDATGLAESVTPYEAAEVQADIQQTRIVPLAQEDSWEEYLGSVEWYARLEHLDLSSDPYMSLLSKEEQETFVSQVREDYYERKAKCDKYDYALSALCGVITGIIDVAFVGGPENSKLGGWTDAQAKKKVEEIGKKLWDKDQPLREQIKATAKEMGLPIDERNRMLKDAGIPYNQNVKNRPEGLQQCIQYLENKFKVNYDATSAGYLTGDQASLDRLQGKMYAKNHHMMSLGHSPDLLGLIFSLIDQFTGEGTYVAGGKIIRLKTVPKKNGIDEFELRGETFIAKLFCGVANWFYHCISDLVGSSGATGRGSGLPIPGFELFQFITVGNFDGKTFAELSIKVFEEGYDARFGAAMAIPVVINNLLVRLIFAVKRFFYHHLPLKECIPVDLKLISRQPELRRMFFVAHGVLCVFDTGDAIVTYVANGAGTTGIVPAAMHLNYFALIRFAQIGFSELRAMYRQTHIDLKAITKDTIEEWDRLYLDAQKWSPVALSKDEDAVDALPSKSMVE